MQQNFKNVTLQWHTVCIHCPSGVTDAWLEYEKRNKIKMWNNKQIEGNIWGYNFAQSLEYHFDNFWCGNSYLNLILNLFCYVSKFESVSCVIIYDKQTVYKAPISVVPQLHRRITGTACVVHLNNLKFLTACTIWNDLEYQLNFSLNQESFRQCAGNTAARSIQLDM